MKRRILVRTGVYAACLALTAWLIRYEAFPTRFADAAGGYRELLDPGALLVDNWMKISYEGVPVGYSHTSMSAPESGEEDLFLLQNVTRLRLNVLGTLQRIAAVVTVKLDAGFGLQGFSFRLTGSQYEAEVEGRRAAGDLFEVEINTGGGAHTIEMEIPDDVIIYSPMTEMAMSKLRPGQDLRVRTLDPVTMTLAEVLVTAVRRETIEHRGEPVETTRLQMEYQGIEATAWMNAEGRMLRQETPLGWVLEASDQDEALAIPDRGTPARDMIVANAVPLAGTIRDPASCRELTLRLHNMPLALERMNSPRQQAERTDEETYRVVLRALPLPAGGVPIEAIDRDAWSEYLAASPFVDARHPEIVAQAGKIVKGAPDALEAARRIYAWVYRNVEKSPTVSLPSALDVLRQRVGDCNEHTYLSVALARAAGIPARIKVGMVYTDGGFMFHAWPAFYVGEWVEMDPTLGQETVGATHLVLLEGELNRQIELMRVIGRVRAEVIEQTYE